MTDDVTTIRVHKETKAKLDDFKIHDREPYEEVLNRLMKKAKETNKFSKREKAATRFIKKAKELYGENVEEIILYGSFVRGEADAESDVDVLIVWDGNVTKGREYMAELATDALLEHDVIISPKVVSPKNYRDMKKSRMPFIENVQSEGIRVG